MRNLVDTIKVWWSKSTSIARRHGHSMYSWYEIFKMALHSFKIHNQSLNMKETLDKPKLRGIIKKYLSSTLQSSRSSTTTKVWYCHRPEWTKKRWRLNGWWYQSFMDLEHTGRIFSSVQSLSHVRPFGTPWTTARRASLSITNSRSLPKLMSVELVMPSNHFIFCHPLLLLPPIPPSIRVFSNESDLRIRWPKYQSFSFNISPSSKHSGLISFRMDWLHLLAVQGTLKGRLQHHSSKTPILRCSAFFIVQLSHPYMTTGKTIALTR